MKQFFKSDLIVIGLAIFSIFFGAGNLMYPLQVGMMSGDKILFGLAGFFLTAVILPVIGFVSMMLFDGDYRRFFSRLGGSVGQVMIGLCMLVIGPMIAIPRITTLSYTMIAPFLPFAWFAEVAPLQKAVFATLFLGVTFLLTYKENRIVDILGNIISPLLLISLALVIGKGILFGGSPALPVHESAWAILSRSFMCGYETLDLLGSLFFSSMILTLLKKTVGNNYKPSQLAFVAFQAGMIGAALLGLVYIGLGIIGVYHSSDLGAVNAGELFRAISLRILGVHGAVVIATAVLMACLSTAIALAAIVGEYVHVELFRKKISYVTSLVLVLLSCMPLSIAGLDYVLALSGGLITFVGYPVLIVLTFANIAYQLCGVDCVKIPVLTTFVVALASYWYW